MSTNPFDDDDFPSSNPQRRTAASRPKVSHNVPSPSTIRTHEQETKSQPPIYSARGVEWPLPPSLDPASYRKYRRASKALGSSLGISGCGLKLPSVEQVEGSGESAGYGGLSGLMGRVLGGASTGAAGVSLSNDIEDEDLQISATRSVLSPRAHCVSASNGWIVAAIECSHPPSGSFPSSSSVGGSSQSPNKNGLSLTSLIPPLRLVSRWNVRRGTSLGSEGNQLVPLPPPVRANAPSNEDTSIAAATDPNFGRIVHTFVDPTGCHVLLSARNGEAYYLHSTSKKVKKLQGFGPNADGSFSSFVPGVSLGDVAAGSGGDVQMGLTPGSFITAVGWDRDRGTEGSTKRIILGTSFGELYEYALVSPNAPSATSTFSVNLRGGTSTAADGKAKSSAFDTKAGELGAIDDIEEPIENPVLLRRLNATTRGSVGDGGAVGGILFQRVTGGIGIPGRSAVGKDSASSGYVVVLASTGGSHKHTRLHTFRSEVGSTSLTLRSAFSRQAEGGGRGSFIELPGSVDFVDLHSCNGDYFALRTETGIYYGSLERTAAAGGGITDAGLLPYDIINSRKGGAAGMVTAPLSIGLTPHHFITLNSVNEVKFVNKVARKVIQQERVDWMSLSQSASTDEFGGGGAAELLMDIRRPDQIWLRKGRSLVHISSTQEDRDEWKFALVKCIELTPVHGSSSPRATMAPDDASVSSANLSTEEKQIDNQFELAKSLCSNASQKAVVNAVRAEYHLSQGRVELAAKYFAQCPSTVMPFSDTAARLALPMLGLDESRSRINSSKANSVLASSNMALITFLNEKLKNPQSKADSSISTMLGSWITELHIHERERNDQTNVGNSSQSIKRPEQVNHALLHQFLSSHVRDLDARTIIGVLSSHDISASETAGYSAASGDIGTAVDAALCGEDAKNGALDALRVLNDAPIDKAEHYYYKHALTLLSRAPMAASKSFLNRYKDGLKETILLPSFMQYERKRTEHRKAGQTSLSSKQSLSLSNKLARGALEIEKSRTHGDGEMEIRITPTSPADFGAAPSELFVNEAVASIRYLEGVIKLGSRSRAIYNYLASLYANLDDEEPLFRFLSTHVPAAFDLSPSNAVDLMIKHADQENSTLLDLSYVLRTILRTGRHMRSAVRLYMGFGMRQQAVELALKIDPSLARELARQSNDKDEKKRLWLMIARSAADSSSKNGKDVVTRVVNVLKDCGRDVLSIEDVLPFLPDFATIDEFKEEICQALSSYSSKIEHYLKEMQECDQACDGLREELGRLRSVETHVRADARCAFTNKYVLDANEPFYAFPSGYVVLEEALKQEIKPFLNAKQQARVESLENELSQLRKKQVKKNSSSMEAAQDNYAIEELQSELDGLIAAECPLTGSLMVNSIDHDFLESDEDNYS